MRVIRGTSDFHGNCDSCGAGKSDERLAVAIFQIRINKIQFSLCQTCYQKLSDIFVFDFDCGLKKESVWQFREFER